MITGPTPVASNPSAINCDEPANTNSDMAMAPNSDKPLDSAKVPKIMPKGIAPIIIGTVALAPCRNSLLLDAGVALGLGSELGRTCAIIMLSLTQFGLLWLSFANNKGWMSRVTADADDCNISPS